MVTTVEHDDTQSIKNNRTISVDGTHTETVKKATSITITEGTYSHDVKAGTGTYHVKGAVVESYEATQATTVKDDITIVSQSGKFHLTASTEIQLLVGSSKLLMKSDGSIELSGKAVTIKGADSVAISGAAITAKGDQSVDIEAPLVKSDGKTTNTVSGGMVMLNP